jgi:uncharacterized membrane protein YkoI
MTYRLTALAAAAVLAALPVAAQAQVLLEPNEVVVRDATVSVAAVRDIAAYYGVARVTLMELEDRILEGDRIWQVEGKDFAGRDIELTVDAYSGAVLDIDR